MLNSISDSDIERFIEEDVPYCDMTLSVRYWGKTRSFPLYSLLQGRSSQCAPETWHYGCLLFSKQHKTVCGYRVPCAKGPAKALQVGWNVALNLFEYASGNATQTQSK